MWILDTRLNMAEQSTSPPLCTACPLNVNHPAGNMELCQIFAEQTVTRSLAPPPISVDTSATVAARWIWMGLAL